MVPPVATVVAWMRTLLYVLATARAPREMAAEVAAAAALGADVAKLRLDRLSGFAPRWDLPVLLAQPRPFPAIVTYNGLLSSTRAPSSDWPGDPSTTPLYHCHQPDEDGRRRVSR
ncbi:hypothetical protein E2562_001989 [Oryza meyeriana var. granulata]|uniref:Thiamine phosphate synthase/TenI domain-containing protein n=1 Tax=Oryza meyeriana var. granulata TaxID=110450 RepID=A0A6G1C3D3_9ORYZ|nr:hypothetical protein E2562_001989 [Oryza meyeriana var. granulata]